MEKVTLTQLKEANACKGSINKLEAYLGKDYAGDITIQDAIKAGYTIPELLWALRFAAKGKEVATTFGIRVAKRVVKDRAWNIWADTWLDGSNRCKKAATTAAAYAAAAYAADAYAAANAAVNAAYAAVNAAAYAAAGYAAKATVNAARAAAANADAYAYAAAAANAAAHAAGYAAAAHAANAATAAAHAANAANAATAANAAAYANAAAEKQYQLQLLVELCNKE